MNVPLLIVTSRVCLLREGALGWVLPLLEGRKGRWGRGNKAKLGPHPSTCHHHSSRKTWGRRLIGTSLADPNCNCHFLLGRHCLLSPIRLPDAILDARLLQSYHIHAIRPLLKLNHRLPSPATETLLTAFRCERRGQGRRRAGGNPTKSKMQV